MNHRVKENSYFLNLWIFSNTHLFVFCKSFIKLRIRLDIVIQFKFSAMSLDYVPFEIHHIHNLFVLVLFCFVSSINATAIDTGQLINFTCCVWVLKNCYYLRVWDFQVHNHTSDLQSTHQLSFDRVLSMQKSLSSISGILWTLACLLIRTKELL